MERLEKSQAKVAQLAEWIADKLGIEVPDFVRIADHVRSRSPYRFGGMYTYFIFVHSALSCSEVCRSAGFVKAKINPREQAEVTRLCQKPHAEPHVPWRQALVLSMTLLPFLPKTTHPLHLTRITQYIVFSILAFYSQ